MFETLIQMLNDLSDTPVKDAAPLVKKALGRVEAWLLKANSNAVKIPAAKLRALNTIAAVLSDGRVSLWEWPKILKAVAVLAK